jgi:hypothetical protein
MADTSASRLLGALRPWLIALAVVLAVALVSVVIEPDVRAVDQPIKRPSASTERSTKAGPVEAPLPLRRSIAPYRGFGTWIDLYDDPNWRDPEGEIQKMVRKGVNTLFLETANWRIKKDMFKPKKVARFVDAAHEVGIKVVAWYVPSFENLKRDLRRSLTAIEFVTENGQYFDSFALDIESTEVGNIAQRNSRMFTLTKRLREEVGLMAVAAITPDPIGSLYWPDFPYAKVADQYQLLMPMGYFTYRTTGARKVARHVGSGIRALRRMTDAPIHYIGGLSMDADRWETRAYAQTAVQRDIMGGSFYDFVDTRERHWEELWRLRKLSS